MTKIEWTDKSWNPVIGCTKCSPGCKICWACIMHNRNLHNPNQPDYTDPFNVVKELPNRLDIPRKWKKPRKIFVNSMSDLFHKDVSDEFIYDVLHVIADTPKHTYQILTKRAERLVEFEKFYPGIWPDNVWLGVSVENKDYYDRIIWLTQTTAKIKFLSLEPLLGPMYGLPLKGIDWVIVGGESGPKSKVRKMELQWARDIIDHCVDILDMKVFYKQGGTLNPCDPAVKEYHKRTVGCNSKGCRVLDHQIWEEMPWQSK